MTVKVAIALIVPTVTVMVWLPAVASCGTVMMLVKLPAVLVLMSPDFGEGIVVLSNWKIIG